MPIARALGAFVLALGLLSGCATMLPSPAVTFDSVRSLRAAGTPPLALGDFTRVPELSEARDRSIGIRADSLQPPQGGTFSGYLRDTFAAELAGAGLLDPNSPWVLSAQLTRSNVSTGGSQSRGELGARFRVVSGGAIVFEKEIVLEDEWPSAFLGAEAIPDAMNHYTALYPKLLAALVADPEFKAALR
jgi:hypothetical protein